MKKTMLFWGAICLTIVLLAGWYLLAQPAKTELDLVQPGYLFFQSGENRSCSLRMQGTYYHYPFRRESDNFSPGYDGGFWLDGRKLFQSSESYVVFPEAESDYARMRSDSWDAIIKREMETLVISTTLDGQPILVIAPANTQEEAMQLLKTLPEQYADIAYFWVLP